MALSKQEREQFLAEPHIAALSVSAGDKRGPLTVPVWYQYTPGGEPWVLTGAGASIDSSKPRASSRSWSNVWNPPSGMSRSMVR